MLNCVKSANRNEQQNRKNQCKNSLNRKTENLNAPILNEEWYVPRSLLPLALLHNTPRHSRENDHMEFWGKEERKNIYIQMSLGSIMSRKLYFGLLSSISNFHGNHLIFSHPPPPLFFYFVNVLVVSILETLFFFYPWSDPWGFCAKKKNPVGPALDYITQTFFWPVTHNF